MRLIGSNRRRPWGGSDLIEMMSSMRCKCDRFHFYDSGELSRVYAISDAGTEESLGDMTLVLPAGWRKVVCLADTAPDFLPAIATPRTSAVLSIQ
jgi:hypothetical protein